MKNEKDFVLPPGDVLTLLKEVGCEVKSTDTIKNWAKESLVDFEMEGKNFFFSPDDIPLMVEIFKKAKTVRNLKLIREKYLPELKKMAEEAKVPPTAKSLLQDRELQQKEESLVPVGDKLDKLDANSKERHGTTYNKVDRLAESIDKLDQLIDGDKGLIMGTSKALDGISVSVDRVNSLIVGLNQMFGNIDLHANQSQVIGMMTELSNQLRQLNSIAMEPSNTYVEKLAEEIAMKMVEKQANSKLLALEAHDEARKELEEAFKERERIRENLRKEALQQWQALEENQRYIITEKKAGFLKKQVIKEENQDARERFIEKYIQDNEKDAM